MRPSACFPCLLDEGKECPIVINRSLEVRAFRIDNLYVCLLLKRETEKTQSCNILSEVGGGDKLGLQEPSRRILSEHTLAFFLGCHCKGMQRNTCFKPTLTLQNREKLHITLSS